MRGYKVEIYVTNQKFEIVGVLDNAESVIWTERYQSEGEFEIYIQAGKKAIEMLQRDYYLFRTETDRGMIIANVEIKTDAETGNYLIVTGKSLEELLGRRIIWAQTNMTGKAELAIRRLIEENVINPSIPGRKIADFALGEIKGFEDAIEMQATGDNLKETIEGICKTYGYGYKITRKDGKFVFDLYRGADRSYNQDANPYIVFSPEFENLLSTDYKKTMDKYRNVVLVAGEGEGLERKTQEVGEEKGIKRYEMYSDARNASTNNGEITEEEYFAQLAEDGKATLAENTEEETFEGTVDYLTPYKYGEDYFMGDIVQVTNEYGISATPSITETIETENEEGYSLIPTFKFLGGAE